jgi:hypothetical protein
MDGAQHEANNRTSKQYRSPSCSCLWGESSRCPNETSGPLQTASSHEHGCGRLPTPIQTLRGDVCEGACGGNAGPVGLPLPPRSPLPGTPFPRLPWVPATEKGRLLSCGRVGQAGTGAGSLPAPVRARPAFQARRGPCRRWGGLPSPSLRREVIRSRWCHTCPPLPTLALRLSWDERTLRRPRLMRGASPEHCHSVPERWLRGRMTWAGEVFYRAHEGQGPRLRSRF